jgi:hypothetical protein
MNREALERPFEAGLIKTKPGGGGRKLAYVEGHEYIRRLNEAFEGRWTFEVVEHRVLDKDVVVLGKLITELGSVMQFGGQPIDSGHELGDVLKAAATDALKKCSTHLGIGLHLYDDEPRPQTQAQGSPAAPPPDAYRDNVKRDRQRQSAEREVAADAPPKTSASSSKLVTDRQLNAIMAIGRSLGWSSEALRQHSIDSFKVPVNQLTAADASILIGDLQQMALKKAS